MNLLITICARGGSKGIPHKNIQPLAGKPLIAHTLLAAQRFAEIFPASIILSTDDQQIRELAAAWGLETPYRRPEALAGDRVGKVAVIKDVWRYAESSFDKTFDFVLDLDVASPLRTLEDLKQAFAKFQAMPQALVLYSVNPAERNPYYTLVEEKPDGTVELSKRLENPILSRQEAPKVYQLNGSFYFYRRQFFEEGHTSVTLDGRSTVLVMDHTCFDIDTPDDLQYMNFLIEGGHLDFSLPA